MSSFVIALTSGHQLGSSADPDDVYIKAFVYSWLGCKGRG